MSINNSGGHFAVMNPEPAPSHPSLTCHCDLRLYTLMRAKGTAEGNSGLVDWYSGVAETILYYIIVEWYMGKLKSKATVNKFETKEVRKYI